MISQPSPVRFVWGFLALYGAAGCHAKSDSTVTLAVDAPTSSQRREEPPVPLNADSPVRYPAALAAQRLSGTVVLRLFVDSTGKVVPDSGVIQESSGYPALDSAALHASPELRYAPALRDGVPVAVSFLQPVEFRASGPGAR